MARSGIALTVLVVGLSLLACADAVGNETSNGSTTYELIDVPLAREAQVAQTLSTIIQSPTVADRDAPQHVSNGVPFEEMHADLAAAFPELYEVVDVELVSLGEGCLALGWACACRGVMPRVVSRVCLGGAHVIDQGWGLPWLVPPRRPGRSIHCMY